MTERALRDLPAIVVDIRRAHGYQGNWLVYYYLSILAMGGHGSLAHYCLLWCQANGDGLDFEVEQGEAILQNKEEQEGWPDFRSETPFCQAENGLNFHA
jgi:hypothetical protein